MSEPGSLDPLDPRDSAAVGAGVATWLAQHLGTTVTVAQCEILTGGFDNFVHALRLDGADLPVAWTQQLVVRIAPSSDRLVHAQREAAVQNWLVANGYPAPAVLAVLDHSSPLGRPAQVVVRAPGNQLLEALTARPLQARALLTQLAILHVRLHALDPRTWPEPELIGRAREVRYRLVRERVDAGNVTLGVALRRVQNALDAIETSSAPHAVCHGDFHPLNVVYDATTGGAVVIDWTDATVDDPHSDIARTVALMRVAAVAGNSALERIALRVAGPILARIYLRAYQRRATVNLDHLARWETLHLLNGLAQLDALASETVESASAGRAFPRWVVRTIERRLARGLDRVGV